MKLGRDGERQACASNPDENLLFWPAPVDRTRRRLILAIGRRGARHLHQIGRSLLHHERLSRPVLRFAIRCPPVDELS